MNKKILSILLALMMLIGLMPNKIVAEELTVKKDDNNAQIYTA